MSCLPGGLDRVSKGFGLRRHAVTACIAGLAVLLTGCLHGEDKPYAVQVECAQMYVNPGPAQAGFAEEKRPLEQFVTVWYSNGTLITDIRPGLCLQEAKRYIDP